MKKFFSLLCAVLLVFSASAAPVAQKAQLVKKAPVAVEQMQKVQLEKAQSVKTISLENAQLSNQLSAAPALTVSNQKAQAPAILGKKVVKANHNAAPAAKPAVRKAANAVAEDINVTAIAWRYDDYYYDVYLQSENDVYLFELLESTGGLTYGTTYTFADMYADWVCTLDEEGYPLVKASDATLTVTKDEAGLIHVAATMVLEGVTHVISYDETPFVPSGVQIPLNGTELSGSYNSWYYMYIYTAKVGENEIQLAFDATAEQATYTKDQFLADYSVYYSPDYSTYVEFVKAASDFTVTNTETTKTLTGSLYADNGDEYILNLVYEKPDAKYIDINVANATLTNKSVAGFWTIDGQTADKNNSFSIYFISKALQGTFTDVAKFDSYSTWVSDKSSGSNVYYENLSEVNLVSVIDGDSLKITGTLSLADANGNPAIVTVYITTPFTQTWGEWEDFAPFDLNTGKYTFTVLFNSPATQRDIPVQVRKDNTGFKQFKFIGWGKQIFTANGIDLIVDMGPDYVCTVPVQDIGVDVSGGVYGENAKVQDYASKTGQAVPSTYDPETGTFDLALSYFISLGTFGSDYETMVMDQPILERDTVYFNGKGVTISECVNSQTGVQTGWFYELADASTGYEFLLQSTVVAEQYGTFSYADKTLGSNYYNVFDPAGGRQQFVEGSITVSNDGSEIVLDGELIAEDEKVYVLHFTQSASVLNYDTDAPFDATFAWSDMDASITDGVIGIYATNAENYTIGLELYADPAATEIPAGTYTISDTQEAGTALQSLGVYGGYLTECWAGIRGTSGISDCWFIVEGTVTLSYDEYGKLKVVVDGKNSYDQPVTALVQYEKLEPKSTVVITDGELVIDEEMYAQYGITTYLVENDNYGFILPVYADTIVGDFTEDLEYALAKVVDLASMAPANIIDVESIVVTGIDKNLTLTAKVLGADTIMYEITATGYLGYIEGDAIDAYEGEFKVADLTIGQAKKNNVDYITIKGTNEVGDSINFAVAGKLVDKAIPAGEYTDVMASTGFNDNNKITTSFVGNNAGVWFVQGGKLTVAEDGSMIFVGVNSHDALVTINFIAPVPPVTDYYLVGWINGAAYGIEGDIDNFGEYHFVDGKVKATFNELSYVQVKDNNKQIYGTDTYKAPVNVGNAILFKTGTEKIAINGGAEYEYTLTVNEDGTLEIFYEEVSTGLNDINADVKANKVVRNGRLMVIKNAKVYSVLGQPIQ